MIAYRAAEAADGPALDAMARQSFLDTFRDTCSAEDMALYLAEAYGADGRLLRDLADPAIRFHLAEEGGRVVGYAKLVPPYVEAPGIGPGDAQLGQLYVAADRLGCGIAPVLMDWADAAARAGGARAMVLTVWENNHRAQRFYRRRGFVEVGEYAFRTGNQVDRDLVMVRAL